MNNSITPQLNNVEINDIDRQLNLDKLAQLRRKTGNLHSAKVLERRARAKYITHSLTLGLINHNAGSKMIKPYWNTYYCNTEIKLLNGELKSYYCKNRFCLVCSRIKTATYINAYYEIIKSLPDLQFLTLTVPNVEYKDLLKTIEGMQNSFKVIRNNYSLRKKLKGIRKLEITYNPKEDTYHPHYHFIISGEENAKALKEFWLKIYKNAKDIAQDITKCEINKDYDSLIELFKYATKIIQKDIDSPKHKTVYFNALNNILIVLRKKRTFQPFGIKKPIIEDDYSLEIENKSSEIEFYHWEQEISDWVSNDGELLSKYEPSPEIKEFVKRLDKQTMINKRFSNSHLNKSKRLF